MRSSYADRRVPAIYGSLECNRHTDLHKRIKSENGLSTQSAEQAGHFSSSLNFNTFSTLQEKILQRSSWESVQHQPLRFLYEAAYINNYTKFSKAKK
jgi:hypothetical protein